MVTASLQDEMADILVVDDYPDAAESMALWLRLSGHAVRIARDGYQAIAMAVGQRPDYVLLDVGLPGLDGYQVASRLRRELGGPLVIIAITGHGREDDRLRALAAGCDHHLRKPIDPNALVRLLSAWDAVPDSAGDNGPPG